MAKYKIKRNKINLGTVIKPLMRIYNKDNLDSVQIIDSKNIRLTLFSINENNFATDLLYDSPEYPIENISNPKDYAESKYIINNQYSLNKLLISLGFNEELTSKDLKKLSKKILSLKDDNNLPEEVINYINKINKFAPGKYEGKIKRLK